MTRVMASLRAMRGTRVGEPLLLDSRIEFHCNSKLLQKSSIEQNRAIKRSSDIFGSCCCGYEKNDNRIFYFRDFFNLFLYGLIPNWRYQLTSGNVDDRKPVTILTKDCFGKLFGDKGYLSSQLFEELYQKGLQLITKLRSNMKNKLMPIGDKLLLKSRGVIESVNDRLKNGCQIEHHRHRSVFGFLANLISGLAAYQLDPQKPSLRLSEQEMLFIQAAC